MALFPKEFGPHRSPEALGKLKTAVATTEQLYALSVSVPNAKGYKLGAFQRVETAHDGPKKGGLPVYAVAGRVVASGSEQIYLTHWPERKKFTLGDQNWWVAHQGRGVYMAAGNQVKLADSYTITYEIADGFGGVVPGTTSTVNRTNFGTTLYMAKGPEVKGGYGAYYTVPLHYCGHCAPVPLFSSGMPRHPDSMQFLGGDKRTLWLGGLVLTSCIVFDSEGNPRVVALSGKEGESDAWGLPKMAYDSVCVAPTRQQLRGREGEDGKGRVDGVAYPFTPPRVPGAGASHVFVSSLRPLGGGAVGCLAGVHPWSRRYAGGYDPSDIALHLGKQHDRIVSQDSHVVFRSSKPCVYFAVTRDYGQSWSFTHLSALDQPVPAWEGFSANALAAADYVTEQPVIGYATYRMQGVGNYNEATQLFDSYDLLFGMPDRPGAWDARCVARIQAALDMCEIVALTPNTWVVVIPLLDDRVYNNDPTQYVRWRCIALRTEDGGTTWGEVRAPFADLVADSPTDIDRGYALKATVLRDGCAVMKFYRGKPRIGDTDSIAGQPRTTRFARTVDYGASWEEVTPVGLPTLDPTMLGSLVVLSAGSKKSTVGVTAWEAGLGTYALYISKDDCKRWKRVSTIAQGEFFPMDEVELTVTGREPPTPQNLAYLVPLLDEDGRPATVNRGAPWMSDASKPAPQGT